MALTDIQTAVAQEVQAAYDLGVTDGKASVAAPTTDPVTVTQDQVLALLKSGETDLEGKVAALFAPPTPAQ